MSKIKWINKQEMTELHWNRVRLLTLFPPVSCYRPFILCSILASVNKNLQRTLTSLSVKKKTSTTLINWLLIPLSRNPLLQKSTKPKLITTINNLKVILTQVKWISSFTWPKNKTSSNINQLIKSLIKTIRKK